MRVINDSDLGIAYGQEEEIPEIQRHHCGQVAGAGSPGHASAGPQERERQAREKSQAPGHSGEDAL